MTSTIGGNCNAVPALSPLACEARRSSDGPEPVVSQSPNVRASAAHGTNHCFRASGTSTSIGSVCSSQTTSTVLGCTVSHRPKAGLMAVAVKSAHFFGARFTTPALTHRGSGKKVPRSSSGGSTKRTFETDSDPTFRSRNWPRCMYSIVKSNGSGFGKARWTASAIVCIAASSSRAASLASSASSRAFLDKFAFHHDHAADALDTTAAPALTHTAALMRKTVTGRSV